MVAGRLGFCPRSEQTPNPVLAYFLAITRWGSGLSTNPGHLKKERRRQPRRWRRPLTVTSGWELSPDCFVSTVFASNPSARLLAINACRTMFLPYLPLQLAAFGSAIVLEASVF